jgi:predicted RNA binding protein YcfA (HicA-like mRNA interferase family)
MTQTILAALSRAERLAIAGTYSLTLFENLCTLAYPALTGMAVDGLLKRSYGVLSALIAVWLVHLVGKALILALRKIGFEVLRIKGSHHFLRHPDGRTTVVPVHSGETLGPGLLSKILRDTEQTRDELEELLS